MSAMSLRNRSSVLSTAEEDVLLLRALYLSSRPREEVFLSCLAPEEVLWSRSLACAAEEVEAEPMPTNLYKSAVLLLLLLWVLVLVPWSSMPPLLALLAVTG